MPSHRHPPLPPPEPISPPQPGPPPKLPRKVPPVGPVSLKLFIFDCKCPTYMNFNGLVTPAQELKLVKYEKAATIYYLVLV